MGTCASVRVAGMGMRAVRTARSTAADKTLPAVAVGTGRPIELPSADGRQEPQGRFAGLQQGLARAAVWARTLFLACAALAVGPPQPGEASGLRTEPEGRQIELVWADGKPAPTAGTVLLEDSAGRIEERDLPSPLTLPPGRYRLWVWGEGWTTLEPRRLEVRRGAGVERVEVRRVPGCVVSIAPALRAQFDSIELISSTGWNLKLPEPLNSSPSLPLGPGLALLSRKGSATEWRAFSCRPGTPVPLGGNSPPPSGASHLLVELALPAGLPRGGLEAFARSTDQPPDRPGQPATGSAWLPERNLALAWFDGLPAGSFEVTVRSGSLRTLEVRKALRGGNFERLSLSAQLRPLVILPLNFRSPLPGGTSPVELLRCASRAVSADTVGQRLVSGRCAVVDRKPLRSGFQRYEFSQVDSGHYALRLELGHDRLVGDIADLPEWLFVVTPESPDRIELEPVTLELLEIQGEVRVNGLPAAGTLAVSSQRNLRFPSAEQVISVSERDGFRLRLLGRTWPEPLLHQLLLGWTAHRAELLRNVPWKRLEGYPAPLRVVSYLFVGTDGRFHVSSSRALFFGSSSWRIELEDGATVEMFPVDKASGEEIDRPTLLAIQSPKIELIQGDERVLEIPLVGNMFFSRELYVELPVRLAVPAGRQPDASFALVPSGGQYRNDGWFQLRATEPGQIRQVRIPVIRLTDPGAAGCLLLGPGREPLRGAYLLGLSETRDGRLQVACVEEANAEGRVPGRCSNPEQVTFLLLHNRVPLYALEPERLRQKEVSFAAPEPEPLRLSLVDGQDQPVTDAEVALAYRGQQLHRSVSDLLRRLALWPDAGADERGVLVLPPLEPRKEWSLLLRRLGEEQWTEVSLGSLEAGEILLP